MKGSLTIAACITNMRHDMQNLKQNNPPDVEFYQVKRDDLLGWLSATLIMWNNLEEIEKTMDKMVNTLSELARRVD